MFSRDATGLDQGSATAVRWRLLRDAGVDISVRIATPEMGFWKDDGVDVVASGGNVITKWWRLWRLAKCEIRGTKYDLISAQDPFELGFIAWRHAKQGNIPFELQDHGGFFDGEPADEPLWFFRSRLGWYLAKRANRIRTVSPKSLVNLKKKGLGDKAYWLPIAADARFAAATRRPEPDLIVSTGRLVSVKRFGLLLDAFAIFRKSHPQARLAILGDGPLRHSLVAKAKSQGLSSAVEFVGAADPLPWLERAACFVLVSKHEGWGVAAVEAALAGVPVVMTDTGCARFLVEKRASCLVEKAEPFYVAKAIEQAMAEDWVATDFGLMNLGQAAKRQVMEWQKSPGDKGFRLMVVCQAVDEDDALFGFFVPWLKEAASSFVSIKVVALRVGRFSLPQNITVMPLRDKSSRSRLAVVWNLWRLSWKFRKDYDGVYIRGDVQYPVLAGWLWRLLGKKVVLFYAHYTSKTKWLKPAAWFCDAVVTSVAAACSLPQSIKIGQGVDEGRFKDVSGHRDVAKALVFGRVSPVKRVPWILEKVAMSSSEMVRRISVVGRSTDEGEAELLRSVVSRTGATWNEQDIANADAPEIYLRHDVYLNATPGSLDKTIIEACMSGLVVLASTPAYSEMLPKDLKWLNPSDLEFGDSVVKALGLDAAERERIGSALRQLVKDKHSQAKQIGRLERIFKGW
jgi:glycosyltransferase involved in cell wall biosynthesis